jgi:phage terminase large subunit
LYQQANETELEINPNDCFIPLYEDTSRFIVLPGGAGSGKSIFCADKIVHRVLCEYSHRFLCLRKVGDTVEDSIFAELTAAIEERGVTHEFKVNKTKHSFLHRPTGNQILCKGLDDVAKMKSIKGITGMWLEEATEFDEDDLDQLNIRIRGEKLNYVQYLLSFNPIDENHWLKKRFIDKKDPDAVVLITTYKDNNYLTEQDVNQLLKLAERNPLYYDVYVLAKWGVVVKSNKFFYAFSNDKHIIPSYEPNPHLPITVSFDFNVVPMTAIVAQKLNDMRAVVFDELKINEGSTEEMCELVKAKYIKWLYNMDITGDATGRNREKALRGNINSYMVIREELELDDRNILVKSKNPENKDARILCNSVLMHAEFQITANCKETINDMVYGAIKLGPKGKIEIIKTDTDGRHFLDNAKYIIDCFYPDFISNPKKYKDAA